MRFARTQLRENIKVVGADIIRPHGQASYTGDERNDTGVVPYGEDIIRPHPRTQLRENIKVVGADIIRPHGQASDTGDERNDTGDERNDTGVVPYGEDSIRLRTQAQKG